MVLEDEAVLYELLHDLLALEGYEVVRPASFDNLISQVKDQRPQAVIVDVNLKGKSGLDLLDEIRKDAELAGTAVLVSSGLDYRQESLERGANAFLMKPYMPDELVGLLKQHLQ
jgi:DNA-binding response OmpR family regulator